MLHAISVLVVEGLVTLEVLGPVVWVAMAVLAIVACAPKSDKND